MSDFIRRVVCFFVGHDWGDIGWYPINDPQSAPFIYARDCLCGRCGAEKQDLRATDLEDMKSDGITQ
jgi:hypothetical protein